ncbi:hypothetical protein QFZ52_002932 [Arthrobacter woluwensis]|uniref:M4 family metallopeptidase n=1 Tax=Arthrobacter woluwensis TaxID=156980 RepID=UPI00278AC90C|nr:M4 family metallopeptidase [Arthrobacter woluwensis]MDQ0710280.1 hypothetical protein [Arthrobacter woluwensis]
MSIAILSAECWRSPSARRPDPSSSKSGDQQLGTGHLSRFVQVIDGHEVAGSSVAQTLDKDGALIQAMGSVATGTTSATFPQQRDLAKGEKAAKEAAATQVKLPASKAKVTKTVWYAPALAGFPEGGTVGQPAYQVVVSNKDASFTVTVAATGAPTVLATATNTHELNRAVCDANRYSAVTYDDLKCGVGTKNVLKRKEGQAASTVADVNAVYNFFGDTSSFYAANTNAGDLTTLVGANYNDGVGTAIRGSVRQCVSGDSCPYTNAFWSDEISAMVYGEGVTTDDVTGHELTHGVTSKTNGLLYQNESGAINESMSDIFGELTDITNGSADDTAANRWKMGEGSSLGVIRDMKSPKNYQQPGDLQGHVLARDQHQPEPEQRPGRRPHQQRRGQQAGLPDHRRRDLQRSDHHRPGRPQDGRAVLDHADPAAVQRHVRLPQERTEAGLHRERHQRRRRHHHRRLHPGEQRDHLGGHLIPLHPAK